MPRDKESLIDIERAARRIVRYAADCDRASLETNDEKVSAILYQITIIGEATKRLSQDFRQQHSEIPGEKLQECVMLLFMSTIRLISMSFGM
jgi:uncharacterized protein with HEPN domain